MRGGTIQAQKNTCRKSRGTKQNGKVHECFLRTKTRLGQVTVQMPIHDSNVFRWLKRETSKNSKGIVHSPYVTDAHVGRGAGQSKHTWLLLIAFSFLNCWFLSFVSMQTLPFPAAVMLPSFRTFPDVLNDMILFVDECSD